MEPVQPASAVVRAVEAERVSGLNLTDARGRYEGAYLEVTQQSRTLNRVPHSPPSPHAARERRLESGASEEKERQRGRRDRGGRGCRTRGNNGVHGTGHHAGGGLFLDESR